MGFDEDHVSVLSADQVFEQVARVLDRGAANGHDEHGRVRVDISFDDAEAARLRHVLVVVDADRRRPARGVTALTAHSAREHRADRARHVRGERNRARIPWLAPCAPCRLGAAASRI